MNILATEELDAGLVEDARMTRVKLRERDEVRLGPGRSRHVAAVELVHPAAEPATTAQAVQETVAGRPGIGAQPKRAHRLDVPRDKAARCREPSRRKYRRLDRVSR